MAYWWASQNKTFKHEYGGGYLWAPQLDWGDGAVHHWVTMEEVQPGDIVFSFVRGAIRAIAVAHSTAYRGPRPFAEQIGGQQWKNDGLRIDATYEMLPIPFVIAPFATDLVQLLPHKYSPLNRHGTGNQGYLYSIPPLAANFILGKIDQSTTLRDAVIARAVERLPPAVTEREQISLSRVGQGQFRQELIALWKGGCSVTDVSMPELLRASHVKPWRDSNNRERLDVFNGLLLTPGYDAAFDRGFISFSPDGSLLLATDFKADIATHLGILPNARLRHVDEQHQPYLDYHRSEVFRGRD